MLRVGGADHHGKRVVESQRRKPDEMEALEILVFDRHVCANRVVRNRLLQDDTAGGAGVFGIDVDIAVEDGFVSEKSAAEVELAFDLHMQLALDLLGGDFAEDQLLGEVFRSDDDGVCAGAGRQQGEREQNGQCARHLVAIFFSMMLMPASAISASAAAGIAPARICKVSADATPRKIKTPRPPPPLTAAMTAGTQFVTS